MNRSGRVLPYLMKKYKLKMEELLVVTDNLDLTAGDIRLKRSGSSSSHNGLKSITRYLGSADFKRLYLGIDRPEHGDIIPHVLGKWDAAQDATYQSAIEKASEVVFKLITFPIDEVMNFANQKIRKEG
jgi:PTH1 family peptidyl-tRNA hydrolase